MLLLPSLVVGWVLFFAFTNGFHSAANVMATVVVSGVLSRKKALLMVTACEIVAPFLLGTAVARTIGENVIDLSVFNPKTLSISAAFIAAALGGAIIWNLLTWMFGFPSSSSHVLVGGLVGAVLAAYGPHRIILPGLLYVFLSLIVSPLLSMIFAFFAIKTVFYLSRNATPRINHLFSRMQIPSSIILALGHGTNEVQKPVGLIAMSFVILGVSPAFHIQSWMIASCAAATALGAISGGWHIIKTVGSKIFRLRPVHAFCAQASSAAILLGVSLAGGPVSTTHVVSSSIIGVGAGDRAAAVRWEVAKNIMITWLTTIPAAAALAALTFFLIRMGSRCV